MDDSMKTSALRFPILLLAGLSLPGCGLERWAKNGFKVGPNYVAAAAPLKAEWIDYQRPAEAPAQPVHLANWWAVFNDPVLDSLMHDAYAQNLTLRQAGERIVLARAV